MPNYTPPFTVYWSTFANGSPNSPIDQQHLWDNVEAIYNIISHSNLTITDGAIYGIIAGSWATGGLNPARFRRDYLVVDPDIPTVRDGCGLWSDWAFDDANNPQGYRQTEILINRVLIGDHYRQYSNPEQGVTTPTLREYLTTRDNNNLAWYWVLNYTHYRYVISDSLLRDEFREFCAESYNAIKQYISTTQRKINPVAGAIFKKHKKRWWKN